MKWFICALGMLMAFEGAAAHADAFAMREAFDLLGGEIWSRTYEGFAFRERILGHVEYGQVTTEQKEQMLERLEAPANRAVAEQLESRAEYVRRSVEDGTMDLAEAAHSALGLAPERVSGITQFIPVREPGAENYESLRQEFLAGGRTRDVVVYLKGEYRPFQSSIQARLEALGFQVRPSYRGSQILLSGSAPEGRLREMSGIDGVDRVTAVRGPGLAEQHYLRGRKAVTE